ncbi:hypothetical protein [Streptomyces sp. NPDC048445]|uniref:hypothetical protein n=1 Tax=Streptomyces sp. NPDC048445 TaxID=3365553 RepID=UPI00371EB7C1
MNRLPDPLQPTTQAGQPTDTARDLINAVEEALAARQITAYRDPTPLPITGTTPPVAQPGRPPMSQKATDMSGLMLASGATTVMVGGTASLVMLASGYADPVVCAIVVGAPAVLVLALSRLVGKAKAVVAAAPATNHHHYNGNVTVDQRSLNTTTRGVIANTRNELPK